MKNKKCFERVVSSLLCAAMVATSLPLMEASAETGWTSPTTETVALRMGVISDSHIISESANDASKLNVALEAFNEIDENYDGLALVGDIVYHNKSASGATPTTADEAKAYLNDGSYPLLKTSLETYASEKPFIYDMGNHEFPQDSSSDLIAEQSKLLFQNEMGQKPDYHTKFKGYHFITAAPGNYNNVMSAESEAWLQTEIDTAIAEDANKPVFVLLHQPIQDTTYGSVSGKYSDAFKTYLQSKPQVIVLSAHTHCTIADPRTVWQDGFSVVSTGYLSGGQLYTASEKVTDGSEAMLLEVTENNVVKFHRMDLVNGDYIGEPWVFDIPAMVADAIDGDGAIDTDVWKYTDARAEEANTPYFSEGATITTSDVSTNELTITFPQAENVAANDDGFVVTYRVQVINEKTQQMQEFEVTSDYYKAVRSATKTIKVDELAEGTDYAINVYGISPFGTISAPLTTNVSTEAVVEENFKELTFSDFGISDGTTDVNIQTKGTATSVTNLDGVAITGNVILGDGTNDQWNAVIVGSHSDMPYGIGVFRTRDTTIALYDYHAYPAIDWIGEFNMTDYGYSAGDLDAKAVTLRFTFKYIENSTDVKMTLSFNGTEAYSGTIADGQSWLGNQIFIWGNDTTIGRESVIVQKEYTELTFSDYNIDNGTQENGGQAWGTTSKVTSMNKVAFTGKVILKSGGANPHWNAVRIGCQTPSYSAGWGVGVFRTAGGNIALYSYYNDTPYKWLAEFSGNDLGVADLDTTAITIRFAFDYVEDSTDVKLTFSANGKQLYSGVIPESAQDWLGLRAFIWGNTSAITYKSVTIIGDTPETGVQGPTIDANDYVKADKTGDFNESTNGVILGTAGNYVEYNVDATAGNYALAINYGRENVDSELQLLVNGESIGYYTLPAGGEYLGGTSGTNYVSKALGVVSLNEGINKICIKRGSNWFTFGSLELVEITEAVSELYSGEYCVADKNLASTFTGTTDDNMVVRTYLPASMSGTNVYVLARIYEGKTVVKTALSEVVTVGADTIAFARFTNVKLDETKTYTWDAVVIDEANIDSYSADYTAVDAAIEKAEALNRDDYRNYSIVQDAIDAVVRGYNITKQAEVDAMAKAITNALEQLELKPEFIELTFSDFGIKDGTTAVGGQTKGTANEITNLNGVAITGNVILGDGTNDQWNAVIVGSHSDMPYGIGVFRTRDTTIALYDYHAYPAIGWIDEFDMTDYGYSAGDLDAKAVTLRFTFKYIENSTDVKMTLSFNGTEAYSGTIADGQSWLGNQIFIWGNDTTISTESVETEIFKELTFSDFNIDDGTTTPGDNSQVNQATTMVTTMDRVAFTGNVILNNSTGSFWLNAVRVGFGTETNQGGVGVSRTGNRILFYNYCNNASSYLGEVSSTTVGVTNLDTTPITIRITFKYIDNTENVEVGFCVNGVEYLDYVLENGQNLLSNRVLIWAQNADITVGSYLPKDVVKDDIYHDLATGEYPIEYKGIFSVNDELKNSKVSLTSTGIHNIAYRGARAVYLQDIIAYRLGQIHADGSANDVIALVKAAKARANSEEDRYVTKAADFNKSDAVDDEDLNSLREILVGKKTLDEVIGN